MSGPSLPIGPATLFRVFLGLGLRGFGGPMAHLALFRREFVEERSWIASDRYDALVALAQLVPGPASSQVGFMLGWRWAGWRGALAAFSGFTRPSAVLMAALGMGWAAGQGGETGAGILRGLMLGAVVVVTQAMVAMVRTTGAQPMPLVAAAIVAAMAIAEPFKGAAVIALAAAALSGVVLPQAVRRWVVAIDEPWAPIQASRWALSALAVGVLVSVAAWNGSFDLAPGVGVAMANFHAGAFVFGGGHVVLPLLQAGTVAPGWVTSESFTMGYGAAQALPGPMFAFAAYLGAAAVQGPWAAMSALLSLTAVFLPGFVFIVAAQAHESRLGASKRGLAALGMVNAAVIGLLGAAIWQLTGEVQLGLVDGPALLVAFTLLWHHRRGALWATLTCVAYTLAMAVGAG